MNEHHFKSLASAFLKLHIVTKRRWKLKSTKQMAKILVAMHLAVI